jgi:hypothetical protein
MTEKKEIKVKKSLLTLILKSIALSILTLFIIQHFGNIRGGDLFAYPKSYIFENPINNTEYSCYWSDGHPPSNYGQSSINNSANGSLTGLSSANSPTSQDRSKHMPYSMKLKEFYLPSLFGNIIHIIIGAILFAGFFAFFGNYKLKLS